MPGWFHGFNAVIASIASIVAIGVGIVTILITFQIIQVQNTIEASPGGQVAVPISPTIVFTSVIIKNEQGDTAIVDHEVSDDSKLIFTVPENAGPGTYEVEVEAQDGSIVSLDRQIKVKEPAASAITPSPTSTPQQMILEPPPESAASPQSSLTPPLTQPAPPTPTPEPTVISVAPVTEGADYIIGAVADNSEIKFQMVILGDIDQGLTTVPYLYSARPNDRVLFRMARTSGEINPQLRIYRPDGTILCQGSLNIPRYTLLEVECVFDVDGLHKVVASDLGGDHTGEYALIVQGTNRPQNAIPVNLEELTNDHLSHPLQARTFSVPGRVGDRVLFRMARTSGEINPHLRIYRPDGTLHCNGAELYGRSLLEIECAIEVEGAYTVLAGDWGGDHTGEFALVVLKTNQ